jgi:hypothetical protein
MYKHCFLRPDIFSKEGESNEAILELDVNNMYVKAMIAIRIPKGNPMIITQQQKLTLDYPFIIEVEIESLIRKN